MAVSLKQTIILIKEVGPIIVPIFKDLLTLCTQCPRSALVDPKKLGLIIMQVCHGRADPIKITKIFVGLICGQGGGWVAFTALSVLVPGAGIIIGSLVALVGNYISG